VGGGDGPVEGARRQHGVSAAVGRFGERRAPDLEHEPVPGPDAGPDRRDGDEQGGGATQAGEGPIAQGSI
jgi:hypothetical protein